MRAQGSGTFEAAFSLYFCDRSIYFAVFNINNLSHYSQVVRIQQDAVALWRHHLNSSSSLTLWWTICRSTSVKLWIFVLCRGSICVTQSSHKWIKWLSKNHWITEFYFSESLNLKCWRYYNYNTLKTVAPFRNNCSPKSINTLLIYHAVTLYTAKPVTWHLLFFPLYSINFIFSVLLNVIYFIFYVH